MTFSKNIFKAAICLFLLILITFAGNNAKAEDFSLYLFAETGNEDTKISLQKMGDEQVMVLPSSSDAKKLCLFSDAEDVKVQGALKSDSFSSGSSINLDEYCENASYRLKFSYKGGEKAVRFLFSKNVPAVFLVSENPSEKGRQWVEGSEDKSNKATGRMVILKKDGEKIYEGALTQIKGRGNSTWSQVKKPYQIKIPEKADLLQTGRDENKSKTWVLLANYLDSSLLNNTLVLKMGSALGMKANIENTHADLYYDGEYRGNYLLSEKVETGSGRVDIEDLEKANEKANEGEDTEKFPVATQTTQNGATFTYCEGMKSPEDITGGYLLEMDYEVRAREEVCYFKTARGQYVTVKSPEYASREEMEYIASLYQEYEDAVYNGGINPSTGKLYSDYTDKESLACYYLINEFTKARDFFQSSAYLYKNKGDEKFTMGPLWDYDMSLGKSRDDGDEPSLGMSIYNTDFGGKLLEIKDFRTLLCDMYESKFYPIVKSILSEENSALSLSYTEKLTKASSEINAAMWHSGKKPEEINKMRAFILQRAEFLKKTFSYLKEEENYKTDFYDDVFARDWFKESVEKLFERKIMSGVSERFFDPYADVSRGQTAQILFNINPEKASFSNQFSDVGENDWFTESVLWATGNNFMEGFPDGSFRPNEKITREGIIKALHRLAKEPVAKNDISASFSDFEKISPDAKAAFLWATEKKILIGDGEGRLNPHLNLTRGELAVIAERYIKRK